MVIAYGVAKGLDSLFGGDDEGEVDYARPKLTSNPDKLQAGLSLAQRLGRYGAFQRQAERRLGNLAQKGITPSGSGPDFNSGDFEMTDAQGLRGMISRNSIDRTGAPIRPGLFNKNVQLAKQENVDRENKAYYEDNIEPAFDSAQGSIQDMLDKPTISAQQFGETKARIAGAIKGDLEKKLRLGGSSLGIRGMDPGSASGAAVLAAMQENASAELANSLSDYGIKVEDLEQRNTMAEAGLLSSLASRRMAAKAGITDPSRMFEISDSITGLLEAIRSQRESEQMQASYARDSGGTDWLGTGIQAAGLLAAPFTMGLSSMGAGAAQNFIQGPNGQPMPNSRAQRIY